MKSSIQRTLPQILAAAVCLTAPASAALVYHYDLEGNFDQTGPGGDPVAPEVTVYGSENWADGIAPGSSQALRTGSGDDNSRVQLGDNDAWSGVTGFSVSAWMQPFELAGDGHSADSIIWLGSGGSARFVLQLNDGGDLRAGGRRIGDEGNFTTELVAGTNITGTTNNDLDVDPISTGQTYHVAATADYETGMVSIYLNGSLLVDRQIEAWEPYGPTVEEDYVTRFGVNGTGGEVFDGNLDDVRIYDHTLSSSEVAALAVPEPSVALLGGLGVLGLLGTRRRNS